MQVFVCQTIQYPSAQNTQ